MPSLTLRYYEQGVVSSVLTEMNPPLESEAAGKFLGFDPATSDAITKDIVPFAIYDPVVGGRTPVAGSLSGSLTTATNADLVVDYTDPDDGRGPVVTWHWFRDGVEQGTTTEPDRTFSDTTVPNDSNAHTFFVRGENVDGLGEPSNLLSLTWGGSSVVAPTAPAAFTRHNLTTLQVDFTWTEAADSRVDKHALFEAGRTPGIDPPIVDNIDPLAVGYTWTGASFGPGGTRHANIGVARHIPTSGAPNNGWSPISNTITFTVPVAAVQHDVVMGATVNDEWTAAKVTRYPSMDACRTYALDEMVSDLNLTGARVLAVTPNNEGSVTSGTALAASLTTRVEEFYYFTDGTPRSGLRSPTSGTEIHFGTDNETDTNNGHPYSAGYGDVVRQCRDVLYTTNPGGARRYPRTSMWQNFTHGNIAKAAVSAEYKPIARYLDGMAINMYPPGRQSHTAAGTANDNIVFTPYANFVNAVITVVQDWMLTGGATGGPSPITSFACWEVGIPIDHPFRNNAVDGYSGEPTDLTNFTIRPRYLTGGIDSTNKDWTGLLQYTHDALDAIGCINREWCYWSQQSNVDIPNPFWHDQQNRAWDASPYPAPYNNQTGSGSTRANPDTETAWFAWQPGRRLAHG